MKEWYSSVLQHYTVEDVVGSYNYHELFPYETQLLYFNGDLRRPVLDGFGDKLAFDIGCGEGRMIRRMSHVFKRVDGADIAPQMVEAASQRCPGSNIYLTDGTGCGAADSDTYDFGYCTISLQHIASYDTRRAILKDLVRILKPTGKITLQMLFSSDFPYVPRSNSRAEISGQLVTVLPNNPGRHAGYFENRDNATGSNGACDCVIGVKDLNAIHEDFLTLFNTCDFWYYDVSVGRYTQALSPLHPNSHGGQDHWQTHMIFIHCAGPKK